MRRGGIIEKSRDNCAAPARDQRIIAEHDNGHIKSILSAAAVCKFNSDMV